MGSKLREARKKKKMSQSELAFVSGVSRATICALENNIERSTSTKTLKRLADAPELLLNLFFLPVVNSILITRDERRRT